MSENRKEQIISMTQKDGILTRDSYPSKELLPHLKIFMQSLLRVIYEETHAEIMDCKSMLKHLDEVAEKYGFKDMPELLEFRKEVEALSKRIKGLEKGQLGEKFGRQSLNRGHERKIVLSNLAFKVEDECAEFDFIVITHKGVFIVEAKYNTYDMEITESGNYVRADGTTHSKIYNIGQSMNAKKYILAQKIRCLLGASGRTLVVPIQNIILYTNNYSKLTDNYHYEQICYCSSIPHYIDNYEGNGQELSDAEMEELATMLRAESVELEYPTEIHANKIRKNLAEILLTLEVAAKKQGFMEEFEAGLIKDFEEELSENDRTVEMEYFSENGKVGDTEEVKTKRKSIFWKVAKVSAGVALMGAGAFSAFKKRG